MNDHPFLTKVLWYLGAGVGLGVLAQGGFPLPGIPPISAPGFWLNVALWPAKFLAGLLGQPIYLQPAVQSPGQSMTTQPGVILQLPGATIAVNQPAATPWGY